MHAEVKQITLFLTVTFLWSWGLWLAASLPPAMSSFGAFGPLVGAVITALVFGDLRTLLSGLAKWRIGWRYALMALAFFPVLIGAVYGLDILVGTPFHLPEPWQAPAILPIVWLYILLLGGPLQEELGWRGLFLRKIMPRIGPAAASLLIGAVWGIWHLPLFLTPGHGIYYDRPAYGLIITTILISFVFTWLYRRTGGSLLAMLVLHTGFNFGHHVFPVLQSDRAGLVLFAVQAIIVLAILWDWRRSAKLGADSHP